MPSFRIGLLVLKNNVQYLKVLPFGRGGHLGHVTLTIFILTFVALRLFIKFGFDWPSGLRDKIFEDDG